VESAATGLSWRIGDRFPENKKTPRGTGGLRAVGRGTARYPIIVLIADIADE
jgi:hypothetical protein